MKTRLWFFVEGVDWFRTESERYDWLNGMFFKKEPGEQNNLAARMAEKQHGVVIALQYHEHTPKMAELIGKLNKAGVPVKLWLVLSDTSGYWTNVLNLCQIQRHIKKTCRWINDNYLVVEGLGIDLEFPVSVAMASENAFLFGINLIDFWFRSIPHIHRARKDFKKVIEDTPLPVEFYAFQKPVHFFVGGGLWPLKGYRVISMDYASTFPRKIRSWAYKMLRRIAIKDSISAIGILGTVKGKTPGRMLGVNLPDHLKYGDLDHIFTHLYGAKEIYIFALDSSLTVYMVEGAAAGRLEL